MLPSPVTCPESSVAFPHPLGTKGLGVCAQPDIGGLCGALGRAVVMWAPVRVFRLSLRDGLHRSVVQPAADTVAAAAGYRGRPGTSNPGWCWGGKVLRGKSFCVDSRGARGEWGQCLGPRGSLMGIISALGGLCCELPRRFGQDGTLQDLSGRHAVTGIRATAFLEE